MLYLSPITTPDANKLDEAYEVIRDISITYQRTKITVPKYFQYDGASIPPFAWQLIGTPFNPQFMIAAVFHDWLYHTHQFDRDTSDTIFYDLLIRDKVRKTKAVIMHNFVKQFGAWYWENDRDDRAYLGRLRKRIKQDRREPGRYGI